MRKHGAQEEYHQRLFEPVANEPARFGSAARQKKSEPVVAKQNGVVISLDDILYNGEAGFFRRAEDKNDCAGDTIP